MCNDKLNRLLAFISVAGSVHLECAPFINLDFELANTNNAQMEVRELQYFFGTGHFPFGTGTASDLLPGWTVFSDGAIGGNVAIGNGFIDNVDPSRVQSHAALKIQGDYYSTDTRGAPPEGRYALIMDNSRRVFEENASVFISQFGDVPVDAQWLTYSALNVAFPYIAINGSIIEDEFVPGAEDFTKRRLDISPWAGQTVRLEFGLDHDQGVVIDSIAFVVPEPGTWALLGLGGCALLLTAWRTRRGSRG